jgi:hypothetical protein
MPFDVRFDDQRPHTLFLARNVSLEEAAALTRRCHAEARAKGLKVVKVPPRQREIYAWEHIDHLNLGLPSEDLGRLSVVAVEEVQVTPNVSTPTPA